MAAAFNRMAGELETRDAALRTSDARRTGSGLGLSITKAIIERHGGTIGVTSEHGRTTFTIQLPHG